MANTNESDTSAAVEISKKPKESKSIEEETNMKDNVTTNGVALTSSRQSEVTMDIDLAVNKADMELSPSKKSSDEAEEDDDDDDDEKLASTGTGLDPERLKAFNMFCRLFVDENLDRMVPISKQPKDKIQAILDACDRQFPEFHERSRKRIRTYLKSCRRMRRARELTGATWDNFRPTPPHLTSPVAESLLAQACENESQNAKRMRLGLDPISASLPSKPLNSSAAVSTPSKYPAISSTSTSSGSNMQALNSFGAAASTPQQPRLFPDAWRFQHAAQPFRPDLSPFFNNGIFRPPFPAFPNPLPGAAAAALQNHAAAANSLQALHSSAAVSSPADMTVKKTALNTTTAKGSALSATEIATIRQLISGYRESATFLYRSADELEQLISHNN